MSLIEYDQAARRAVIRLSVTHADSATAWQLDNYGSIQQKIKLRAGANYIDCSHWRPGTWFIRVEMNQGVELKKILITE